MKTKEQLLETVRKILQDNDISVYSLAKITGINRSTLQKALSGARPLNLRQFKSLLDALPISLQENRFMYNSFLETTWDKERIASNNCILDILDSISLRLGNSVSANTQSEAMLPSKYESVYSGKKVSIISSMLVYEEIKFHNEPKIYTYLPLNTDFISSVIVRNIDNMTKPVKVSVLFEFLKSVKFDYDANLVTLKSLIPMILDTNDRYSLHYFYVDDYIYNNHPTPYPYYIVLSDRAFFLNVTLDNMLITENTEIIKAITEGHIAKTREANILKTSLVDLSEDISFLMNNHIESANMYAISYEPCISSFVPPEMYPELITDNFPNKAELMALIKGRLSQITEMPTKYAIFNKDSISDFVENGNIVPFKHPCLKMCTLEQRKTILSNIYNSMDDKKVILRAFSSDKINVSKHYEITDIQSNYNFQILVYSQDCTFRLINICEPVISKAIVRFFNDIIETSYTFTYEQTRELIKENIDKLDKMIEQHKKELT